MGPHGIPCSCQLSGQASDGGSFEAQLSDRPADRPHTQTRPGGAHPLVMFQERHRLAGVFAAYPASLKPPEPCRDPGPGCVDHLHRHAPVALSKSPRTRAANQLVARLNIKHQSIWGASHAHQMEALQTDEQITTIKRHTAAGRARHRPMSLKTAGVEVRSSSRTSTSTRNPRSTPSHPHSTRKSPYTRRLVQEGIEASAGAVGSSYDNVAAEALNKSYKRELVWCDGPWKGRADPGNRDRQMGGLVQPHPSPPHQRRRPPTHDRRTPLQSQPHHPTHHRVTNPPQNPGLSKPQTSDHHPTNFAETLRVRVTLDMR